MADFELPGYEIYERLGRGGMATVYRALHLNLDREVAIKVMDPAMSKDETFSERFIREARISARLIHPHILQIYDVNTYQGYNYIAMELLAAGDLDDLINTPLTQHTLYQVMEQMTDALDYASGKGYVHRDIKPSNILLRAENDYVLADFGIARAANSGTQMTQTGLMVGTPSYMSPEQAKGLDVDGRSDLYSLAVLWYEMMVKELPYDSDSAVTTAVKHLTEAIPTLPEHLSVYQDFLDKAMAKSAKDRFQTGREMYEAFRECSLGFADDQVLTQPSKTRREKPDSGAFQAGDDAYTSLEGGTVVMDTGQTVVQPSSPRPSSPRGSRPYKLQATGQRESLVSGMHVDEVRSRLGDKPKKSRGGLVAALVVLALAGAGGGYYLWQEQQQSSSGPGIKSVTSELAAGYSAIADNNLAAAAASFRKVLSADRGNDAAEQGMDEVESLYTASIERALAAGDASRSQALISDFGLYFNTHSNLSAYQDQLDQLRATQQQTNERERRIAALLQQAQEQTAAQEFGAARTTLEEVRAIDAQADGLATARDALARAEAEEFERQNRWAAYTQEQREAFLALVDQADTAMAEEQFDRADALLAKAGAIAPDVPALASAQEKLAVAREAAAREAAELQVRVAGMVAAADATWAKVADDPQLAPEAARQYREVLELDPGNDDAEAGLNALAGMYVEQAQALIAKSDFSEAEQVLATATEVLPDQAQPRSLFEQLPDLEQAYKEKQAEIAREREELERALQQAAEIAQAGIEAVNRGELEQAREAYDEVAAEFGDTDGALLLRDRLTSAYAMASREQLEAQDYDAAQALVEKGQSLAPNDNRWEPLYEEIELARSSHRRRLGAF